MENKPNVSIFNGIASILTIFLITTSKNQNINQINKNISKEQTLKFITNHKLERYLLIIYIVNVFINTAVNNLFIIIFI